MMNSIMQYGIYLVNLDPTVGHEIKKTRPCVIISPEEMNDNIQTVIIAPMITKSHSYPTRIPLVFSGKKGWIVLDQIRAIDKIRLIKKIGSISSSAVKEVKSILKEMLVD